MTETIRLYKNNRSPSIADTITVNGSAFDLTASSVMFKMRDDNSSTLVTSATAVVVSAAAGTVRYDWAAGDVDEAGDFVAWWQVTLPDGRTQDTPEFRIVIADHAAQAHEYITVEELKDTLGAQGYAYADSDVTRAIAAASLAIDRATSRRFWLDPDATSVRYYTPDSRVVMIDDLVTLTSVAVDRNSDGVYEETWVSGTDFLLGPTNAAADGKPYEWLEPRYPLRTYAPYGQRSVKVTGKFGWPAVPADIELATTILATRLVQRSKVPFGIVTVTGDVSAAARIARTDPDVASLIQDYKRNTPLI